MERTIKDIHILYYSLESDSAFNCAQFSNQFIVTNTDSIENFLNVQTQIGTSEKQTVRFDVIFLDLSVLISKGFSEILLLKEQFKNVPIIVLSSEDSPVLVKEAIKSGADDYITLPISIQNIEKKVLSLVQAQKSPQQMQTRAPAQVQSCLTQMQNCPTHRETRAPAQEIFCPEFDLYIGNSPQIIELKQKLIRYAKTESPILILGEKGSGKTFLANIIHKISGRKGHFVAENAANFNESIANAQLFGTKKGSYTGAENSKGLFEQAKDGTLFLDEIAETPLNVQGIFLRAIEEHKIRPVGGTEIDCDVRIITATNQNLSGRINNNLFRADLYDRISTLKVTVPSLKERLSDIPLLVENFLKNKDYSLSDSAIKKLQSYDWPGNIRELKSVLERSAILCEKTIITANDIIFDD